MSKVFLGGVCNKTTWRDELIPMLKIEHFNPVITDREWTEEDRDNEIKERKKCDFVLFVFSPRMSGLYSIAEVVDDSNKRPESTILFIKDTDVNDEGKKITFIPSVTKSMEAIKNLVKLNGAKICNSLEEVAEVLNTNAEDDDD